MGEDTQVKTSDNTPTETPKPDLSLFRTARRELVDNSERPEIMKEVVNDDIKESIGNDGEIDESLFKTVDEYLEIVREPYAVKYYRADEIYNALTEKDFEAIDNYVMEKIRSSNQKSTFEVYHKILGALEDALQLSDDHQTMHRITTVAKFIKHGTQRI